MSLPAPDLTAKEAEALLGETLSGRFRLDSILGNGSMGTVYKAYHLGLHKDVAVKLLHHALTADGEMVARFDREAAAVSRLDHPNCVRIMDFGSTEDGRRYLVMEYLEGRDLADVATEPMPPFRVVELVRQVLEGLAHAHSHGLVHRDIKHENIFVLGSESGEQVKLLDFGIAKVSRGAGAGQLTQAGMVFGTPHFMSPEQARGDKTDARSDLYSLGIVMYSMLAGELPFHGDDAMAILRQQIAEPPPPLPDSVPESLRRFVRQLLAKDPEERFADATAAIAALRRAASPTAPPAKAKLPPPPKLSRPVGLPRPKPPTVGNTLTPAPLPELPQTKADPAAPPDTTPEDVDADMPELEPEELVTLATNDGGEAKPSPEPESEKAPPAPPKPSPAAATTPAERPPWLLPAIGVGAIALLALIIAAWPDGDDAESSPETAAADENEDAAPPDAKADDPKDAVVVEDDAPENAPAEDGAKGGASQSERALRATLASVDALIESKEYEAARITIGPLLEVYADEPGLHWRMGRVLVALGRKNNATAALESYRSALALKPDLIDDEEFSAAFWDLLDDPRHRELSSQIAIDLLGDAGHERLAQWVNVQKGPLSYASRKAVTDHLREAGQAERINEPLQTALDLWQANTAESPCEAFHSALAAAKKNPDSYLLGTLSRVSVPTTGEGDEAVECPGLAEALASTQETYAQRYAGLDPSVPAAFQRRKSSGQSSNRRRRR